LENKPSNATRRVPTCISTTSQLQKHSTPLPSREEGQGGGSSRATVALNLLNARRALNAAKQH
jgi:hypothetical protein